MNGIAYDERRDRIFVTGKQWRRVFEVKISKGSRKKGAIELGRKAVPLAYIFTGITGIPREKYHK